MKYSTCKCSTFAVSSVRSRRVRPPHVGKSSDTQTDPRQERIRRWSRMSLARPGCPSGANSAKEARSAEWARGLEGQGDVARPAWPLPLARTHLMVWWFKATVENAHMQEVVRVVSATGRHTPRVLTPKRWRRSEKRVASWAARRCQSLSSYLVKRRSRRQLAPQFVRSGHERDVSDSLTALNSAPLWDWFCRVAVADLCTSPERW